MVNEVRKAKGVSYGVGTTADTSAGEAQDTSITSSMLIVTDEAIDDLSENETKGSSLKTTQQPIPTTAGMTDEPIEELSYGTGKPKRVILRARLIHD